MMTRKFLGLGAIAFTLFTAGHGSAAPAKTLDVRVGGVNIQQGKVHAALLSGADQGILPGDKGFFTKDGVKVIGSDFEVYRIGDRVAWTQARFPTIDTMRFRTSLTTRITTTRTCTAGGKKPDFSTGGQAVVLGRTPPKGFEFANITFADRASDTSITFTIDKGTDDGVMPSSSVYSVIAGTGMPHPYAVDITWVSATTAGGTVQNVNPDEALKIVRKLGVEKVTCKKAP